MKSAQLFIYAAFTTLLCLLTGCAVPGSGSPGASEVQTGTARADGSTPYALGRTRPSEHAGLADAARAGSRPEAALEVSGAGGAELARRETAATYDRGTTAAPDPTQIGAEGDQILLDRVRLALSSTTPEPGALPIRPFTIQELNNVQISVRRGVVTLTGLADSVERKHNIEALVRAVPGVSAVVDDLRDIQP